MRKAWQIPFLLLGNHPMIMTTTMSMKSLLTTTPALAVSVILVKGEKVMMFRLILGPLQLLENVALIRFDFLFNN